MRKRSQIVLAVLLVAILGMMVWQVLRLREPVYQGKQLSVWLKQYGATHWMRDPGSTESNKQAHAAIRQIGTNAIPLYLRIISARESPLKLKLLSLIPNRWLTGLKYDVYNYRHLGAYGLIALGADAKPAVPALITLLSNKDPEVRYTAVFALRSLGPVAGDALPSIIKCLQDPESRCKTTLL